MTIDSKNLLVAIKAYSRANPLPLDASEVHESLEAAQAYAASAKAYPGQTIKVLQNGVYESYVLNPGKNGEPGLTLGKISAGSAEPVDTKAYVQVVEELPTSGQEQGVIYIDPELKGQIWTGDAWKVVFEQIRVNLGGLDPEHPDGMGTIQEAHDVINRSLEYLHSHVGTLEGGPLTEGSVDWKIAQAIAGVDHLKRQVVSELPQENIDLNTIYMVPTLENPHVFNEYMYMGNGLKTWELIGNTAVDLSDYYTKDEVYTKNEAESTFATIAALAGYALKSDIPTVPTKVSELQNDLGFLTEHQDLSEYAKKSELPDVSNFVEQNQLQNYVLQSTYSEKIDSLDGEIESLNQQNSALAALVGKAVTNEGLSAALANYPTKLELEENLEQKSYATKTYVDKAIENAQIGGGEGSDIDLTSYVKFDDLQPYAKKSDLGSYTGYNSVVDYVNAAVSTASLRIVEF